MIDFIASGTISSPRGFCSGATRAGIKESAGDKLDLGILFSEAPCAAAAIFTSNKIKAAPVVLSQQRLKSGRAAVVVMNSGCANAFTGKQGLADAAEMADLAAGVCGVLSEDVLVASTGVIGQLLPMERLRTGMRRIVLSREGGHDLARAIMTTDTVPKEVAARVDGGKFIIGGIAKGAGMIHPELATLLCFLATDAAVNIDFLRLALRKAADISFNMVSIDGDTSTNDTVLIMANGLAGNAVISQSNGGDVFQQALNQVCIHLAKSIARDGEGATRLIEVIIRGAASVSDARLAARAVVSSPLVKTAVHGNDPNWGRIVAAVGASGVEVVEPKIDLYIGNIGILKSGQLLPFDKADVIELLEGNEVLISVNLNLGTATATAWGCDLSEEYVTINSQYTT